MGKILLWLLSLLDRRGLAVVPVKEWERVNAQLNSLLYAVQQKFPGKTRFETALEYIQAVEKGRLSSSVGFKKKGEGDE